MKRESSKVVALVSDDSEIVIEHEDIAFFRNNGDYIFRGCYMFENILYMLYYLPER